MGGQGEQLIRSRDLLDLSSQRGVISEIAIVVSEIAIVVLKIAIVVSETANVPA
jgi:hypothetical protein